MDGNPQIILMDIGSAAWKLDEYKSELWDKCNLGIPHLDIEANDAVILGYMVADFLGEVSKRNKKCFIVRQKKKQKQISIGKKENYLFTS